MNPLHCHRSYLAFLGHRISGLLLALFLPVHFLLLGTAFSGDAALDNALALTDYWPVKVAEWGLVVLLATHMLFGLRILALEFTDWPSMHDNRTGWILPAAAAALFVGFIFWLQV